jgi:hypothetical protein
VTTLVIDELITELDQPVKIEKKIIAESIRLHLYFHNLPSGSFNFEIHKESGLYRSFPFNSSQVRSLFDGTKDFFHVYLSFGIGEKLILDRGNYHFKITQSGYDFSPSSFVGWCKDFQGYFGRISDENAEFTEYPYAFRIIERRPRET